MKKIISVMKVVSPSALLCGCQMKAFYSILTVLVLFPLLSQATKDCEKEKENIRLGMVVAASNIANIKTTRIPDGGPYAKKILICKSQDCEIAEEKKFVKKYLPKHVDADDLGYVLYPRIDVSAEKSKMTVLSRQYEETIINCKN